MTTTRLGWPGRWWNGHLHDECGDPVHLYPFPVNAEGRGPCSPRDPEYDHDECWCPFEGCIGVEDELGFPLVLRLTTIVTLPVIGRGTAHVAHVVNAVPELRQRIILDGALCEVTGIEKPVRNDLAVILVKLI